MKNCILDFETAAAALFAISHPIRLQILTLTAGGEWDACSLSARLDASEPAISKHLQMLRTANLISGRQEGRRIYYTPSASAKALLKATDGLSEAISQT